MKIILLSDCHIMAHNPVARLDDAHEVSIRKFRYVLEKAFNLDGIVLTAGDMFDRPRSWYLLPEMVDLLKNYKGVEVYSIFGQHDQYFYSHETRHTTNLGILAEMELVTILDGKSQLKMKYGEKKVWIYGAGEGEKVPEVEKKGEEDINILVIHDDISDRPLWLGHDYIQAKRFLLRYGDFHLILCGDIHRKFMIEMEGRIILNSGPMMRKTADLWEHEPGFFVYHTHNEKRKISWNEIPHSPPEEVLTREHLDDSRENEDMLDDFMKAMKIRKVEKASFASNLGRFIEENDVEQDIVDIISKTMEKKDE